MFSMTPYIWKLCVLSVSQIPGLWDYRYLSVSSVCLMLNYIFVHVNDTYLLISLSAVWASASVQQCGHEIGGTLCRSILLPRGPQGLNSGLQNGQEVLFQVKSPSLSCIVWSVPRKLLKQIHAHPPSPPSPPIPYQLPSSCLSVYGAITGVCHHAWLFHCIFKLL